MLCIYEPVHCSTLGVDVGPNPTFSIAFYMLIGVTPKGRFTLLNSLISHEYHKIFITIRKNFGDVENSFLSVLHTSIEFLKTSKT